MGTGPPAADAAGLRIWAGAPRREVGDPRAQTLQPPADIGEVCILDWGMHCILEGDVAEEATENLEHLLDLHLGREEPADVVIADAGAVLGSKFFASRDCVKEKLVDGAIHGFAEATGVGSLREALKEVGGVPEGFRVRAG